MIDIKHLGEVTRCNRPVDMVAITLPDNFLELIRNRICDDGQVRLEMPTEFLVKICESAEGVYF
jgi:hypothetical protein